VGDEDGKVVGIIFEGDLAKEPNVEVIMVDHNEPSQAIEGIENYKILEVIDHHRLGNLSTSYPITFINRVVGATCTIITNLYLEQRVPLEKGIASILLCGILSDTLVLKSATTTDTDIEAAEYLASITGLDINTRDVKFNRDIRLAAELGTLDMIKQLLDKGMSVNLTNTDDSTLLHVSSQFGHLQATKVLVEIGADKNYINIRGSTPLIEAAQNSKFRTLRLLTNSR
jgi:manganese-dependent inorganic pyrophosphatase